MTLGFELSALKAFRRPTDVLNEARTWSQYVGIVANDSDQIESYVRRHELDLDFVPGDRDKWLTLEEIRKKTNTDRHVLIGESADGRLAAEQLGWEFISIEVAAEKTGWELEAETRGRPRFFDRLRGWL